LPPEPPLWLPPEPPLWFPPEPPLWLPPEPPLWFPPEPPLWFPPEPPLWFPPEPPLWLPPEPLPVPLPEPQAAKRTASPTLVIEFRALFIAPSSVKSGTCDDTTCDVVRTPRILPVRAHPCGIFLGSFVA
jgi:hypothetical protein